MTMFFFLDYGGLISKLVVVVHTYRYCSGWLRNKRPFHCIAEDVDWTPSHREHYNYTQK